MLNQNQINQFIRLSTILLLIGSGVSHFTNSQSYSFIFNTDTSLLTLIFGEILILFGVLTIFWKESKNNLIYFFSIPSLILLINTIGSYIKSGFVVEQIVEHTSQIALPIIFILAIKQLIQFKKLINLISMTIALTFIGHGLFAVGLHYQPGNFMQMTMNILGFDRIQASIFLLTVGLLDFIVVLGLLSSKTRIISLSYMILWGFLTALARSVFMLNEVSLAETFINYTPMTILRFPNSLLPLLLLLNYRTPRSKVFTLKNQTI